jgi:CxxC-x17-CxxC domain-containing protein
MPFQERTLQCVECGADFTFTADEQEFFANKGFRNDPKRCPTCRTARKSSRYGDSGYSRGVRTMYPVTCAQCGAETEVPFQPRGDRPVYCSSCYSKVRLSSYR